MGVPLRLPLGIKSVKADCTTGGKGRQRKEQDHVVLLVSHTLRAKIPEPPRPEGRVRSPGCSSPGVMPMTEVTRILSAIQAGDSQTAAKLLPLVYDELRALAAARLAAEAPGHTLDATALVHEAYLRLVGDQHFDGRGHFFAAAAEAMRRILVETARRKAAVRHGGGRRRVPLEDAHRIQESSEGLLDFDDA